MRSLLSSSRSRLWPSLSLALLFSACSDPSPPAAKHLVVITVDTLRADRVGCYGGRAGVSDAIDSLARDGVRFESTFAPAGMTLPSTVALFTGRYPDENGVDTNHARLGDEHVTLAERLKNAGFRNRGWVTNGVLKAEQSGLGQGFDEGALSRTTEPEMTAEAVAYFKDTFGRAGRDFVWLHYVAPHAPYEPPAPTRDQLGLPAYPGEIDGSYETLNPVFIDKLELTDADVEHVRGLYDGEILFVDQLVGEVLAALKQSGAADDTLVVFTADHGDELYDHNCYFFHANSIYRGVTEVPLLMRYPKRLPAGVSVTGLAELVDVVPTVLSLLGVGYESDPPSWRPRGMSLVAAAEEQRPIERTYAHSQFRDLMYMVRTERWSYLDNASRKQPREGAEGGVFPVAPAELYDRRRDPYEQYNVALDHPEVVAKMAEALAQFRKSLVPAEQYLQDLTPERIAELREMGYLGAR